MGILAAFFTPARRAVIALAALIAMLELDRLVGETLGVDGQVYTLSQALSPGAFGSTSAWSIWETAVPSPMPLIGIHVLLDVIFFACYISLLRRVSATRAWKIGVRLLLAAEILEDLMILIETQRGSGEVPADVIVAFAATAKWIFVAFLILRAFSSPIRQRIVAHLRTARDLIGVHRVGLAILAILAAVSLIPQAGVVEQLPDIQRTWITWDYETGAVSYNLGPIGGALLVALLVVVSLMTIGRVRSRHFARLLGTSRTPPDGMTYLFWFAAPIIAWLVFVPLFIWSAVNYRDPWRFIDIGPFLAFMIITILVGLGSFIWDHLRPPNVADVPFRAQPTTTVARVNAAGEAIAATALTIVGLGVIRSFTAPMLLGLPQYREQGPVGLGDAAAWSTLFVGIGLAVALLGVSGVFGWLIGLLDAIAPSPLAAPVAPVTTAAPPPPLLPPAPTPPALGELVLRWVMGIISLAFLGLVAWWPLQLTQDKALATAVGIVVAWGALITVVESRLQEHRPLRLFGELRLRSAPLLTLFVAIPLLVAQFGGPAALHAIQSGTSVRSDAKGYLAEITLTQESRPTLADAFEMWASTADCTVTTGGTSYRPLVLVAAQGGGIRAATWTTNVLSEMLTSGGCAEGSVLLSSGASGGSVGLALFRRMEPETTRISTDAIRDEDALAAGLAGTLIMDAFAATTGIRVPSTPGYADEGRRTWQDRAALIQAAWASNSGVLSTPYDFEYQPATGWLLLNSTAAGADCRAVISQLNLQIGVGGVHDEDPTATCVADTPPAVSGLIDVQAYCDLDIDWATAAMLSARFPIVTPAGRISGVDDRDPACKAIGDLQLADGGYSENSGLGTLSDLAPDLTALIRAHNAIRGTAAPIVPFVLYARNEGGADVAAPDVKPASELLVPLLANGTKSALISDAAWLQRLSDDLEDVCPTVPAPDETAEPDSAAQSAESSGAPDPAELAATCEAAVTASRQLVEGGVAVAAPRTEPAVISPLGWTLSDISRTQLRHAVASEVDRVCTVRDTAFAEFGDLLDALTERPVGC